jgi:hypothetical protein
MCNRCKNSTSRCRLLPAAFLCREEKDPALPRNWLLLGCAVGVQHSSKKIRGVTLDAAIILIALHSTKMKGLRGLPLMPNIERLVKMVLPGPAGQRPAILNRDRAFYDPATVLEDFSGRAQKGLVHLGKTNFIPSHSGFKIKSRLAAGGRRGDGGAGGRPGGVKDWSQPHGLSPCRPDSESGCGTTVVVM